MIQMITTNSTLAGTPTDMGGRFPVVKMASDCVHYTV
jgi:hypothetical protein